MNSKNFYNEVSGIYEKMIDFEKNLKLRIDAYKNIIPGKLHVADIGCGVGLDSIALALNGHEVSSFDISPNMIDEAKANAEKYGVKVNAAVGSFGSIQNKYNGKFDAVVSVGNTIAHINLKDLKAALKRMNKLLTTGGKIFLHILNYELIIKESKRINNIANRDGNIIIRLYDFGRKDIDFNIISFDVENPKAYKIVTTKHYPHNKSEINSCLKSAGFSKIKFSKNFAGDKFDLKNSKDIFIEAVKK